MKGYLLDDGSYYESENGPPEREVPQRPDSRHKWDSDKWVPGTDAPPARLSKSEMKAKVKAANSVAGLKQAIDDILEVLA